MSSIVGILRPGLFLGRISLIKRVPVTNLDLVLYVTETSITEVLDG